MRNDTKWPSMITAIFIRAMIPNGQVWSQPSLYAQWYQMDKYDHSHPYTRNDTKWTSMITAIFIRAMIPNGQVWSQPSLYAQWYQMAKYDHSHLYTRNDTKWPSMITAILIRAMIPNGQVWSQPSLYMYRHRPLQPEQMQLDQSINYIKVSLLICFAIVFVTSYLTFG